MKSRYLLTSLATLILLAAAPAMAADMRAPAYKAPPPTPAPVAYNWSGFYIGAHGGGAWTDMCHTSYVPAQPDGCGDGDGWVGGGQFGFNVQNGQFVFGVEISGSWADITGTTPTLINSNFYQSKMNAILMATGRVGMTFDRLLLYVTGGGAWARAEIAYDFGAPPLWQKQNRTGWTIGAGLEYGLTPNWSIAAQYNFIDFGDKDVLFPFLNPFTIKVETEVHIATVRLNYRFGGFGGPVVARY